MRATTFVNCLEASMPAHRKPDHELSRPRHKAYGNPNRPESAAKAAQMERVKVGKWIQRRANVVLRDVNARALDKHSAQEQLRLGSYIAEKLGPLGDLDDLGKHRREALRRRRNPKYANKPVTDGTD